MEFKEAVKIALQSLWANKLRSVLTLLGVMIGVASVIAVVTLVNGANTYVTTKFTRYGADVFTVSKMPQIITSSEDYERFQKRKNILFADYQVCARQLQALRRDWRAAGDDGKGGARDQVGRPIPAFAAIRGRCRRCRTWTSCRGAGSPRRTRNMRRRWRSSGRTFTTICLQGVDPLGQELRVDGTPYTVIGVSEKQGSTFGAEPGQLGRQCR